MRGLRGAWGRAVVTTALGFGTLAGLICGAQAQTWSRVKHDRLVVFGDSLSDNGNLWIATGGANPPYPSQRFSNGPVWAEYLAGSLNKFYPLGPVDNAANVDFAFGGSRTDTLVALPPGVPTQIGAYVARGGGFGANNLAAVWAGANDLFQAIPVAGANPATAQAVMTGVATGAAANVATSANQIAGLGARSIVVLNLPDIGAAPAFNTGAAASLASYSATTFNAALAGDLAALAAARPATNIVSVDIAGLFNAAVANPGAFGFSNVTQACVAVASCASAPQAQQNAYLFWDGVHPTTAGHALIAAAVREYLMAPISAAASAAVSETALTTRRSDAMRGFDRLREHAAATGVNEYFVNPYGDVGRAKGGARRFGEEWRLGGVQFGMTRALTTEMIFGMIGSVSYGSIDGRDGSRASFDMANFSADLLGAWRRGGFFVNGGLGAGVGAMTDWKRKTVGPLQNEGDSSVWTASAMLESGYEMRMGSFALTPSARLGWLHANAASFTENGVVAPIAYRARSIDALTGGVELRAGVDFLAAPGQKLTGYALVGYEDFLSYSGGAVKGRLYNNTALPFSTSIGDLRGEGVIFGGGLSGQFGAAKLNADYRVSLGKGDGVRHRFGVGARMTF